MTTTPSNEPTEQKEKQKGIQLPAALELRYYFATAAMQGMIAATKENQPWPPSAQYAHLAYEFADAMLAERDK